MIKSPLTIQQFQGHNIRVYGTKDHPVFVASDIETIRELTDIQYYISKLANIDKYDIAITNNGNENTVTALTLYGLYSILKKIKSAFAKNFKFWLSDELLPSIRGTGKYSSWSSVVYRSKPNQKNWITVTEPIKSSENIDNNIILPVSNCVVDSRLDMQLDNNVHPQFPSSATIWNLINSHPVHSNDQGYVYLITEHPFSNLVKIGSAIDPRSRMQTLQTGNPRKLVLTHVNEYTGHLSIELLLHQLCAEFRVQGEWFRVTSEELNILISAMCH